MVVKTGAFSYLQWGEEEDACCNSTYGVPPPCIGDVDKPFGYEQKITNWSFTNNPIVLQQLDNIHLKNYAFGRTQGSIGIDAVLANPFWLRNIFGPPIETLCADPFLNTYNILCVSHEYLGNSFTIEVGYENAAADITRQLSGAIINSVSLRSTVGETVKASFDISYASEKEASVCIDATPAAEVISGGGNFIPYTFAHAQLETNETCCTCCPVLVSEVQCLDFTINPQQEMLWGLGSNAAVSSFKKFFELTGSFKSPWKDTSEYDNVKEQLALDGTTEDREQHNLVVTFANCIAACTAGRRDIIFTFGGISIRSFDLTVEPNEPMWQTIPWQARCVSVAAKVGAAET